MYSLCFKLYTNYTLNPTQRAFKTLHSERSQNYTRGRTQTLHFVFEHESREWNFEREWNEWSESYVTFVTNVTNVPNVTNVTNVTNVRNVKKEMAIGGDATRHSLRLFLYLTLPLFDSSSLCPFLSPSRRFITPARRPKNPTILSDFSAIRH